MEQRESTEKRPQNGESVSIIGAGSWGTTVAKVIAENKPEVTVKLWAYEKSVVKSIADHQVNELYLPGIKLPRAIHPTNSLSDAVSESTVIIIATPSKVVHEIAQKISRYISDEAYIGYLTKGFCRVHNKIVTISEALLSALSVSDDRIVALSGPSHAEELVKEFHTCLNVAGASQDACQRFASLLSCRYLECRITDDIKGVELGGTLKNPAAIAAGMISVLPNCGDNLTGALITESFKEILRIGRSFQVNEETLCDISGLGDLIATAMSEHSRNRRFGRDIARRILSKGQTISVYDRLLMRFKPESVFEKMSERLHYLAEGAYAIEPLIEIADQQKIAIPVYRSLYEILLNKKSPDLLIETVKNPARFDEIYQRTKVHVTKRKKGMERVKAALFRNVIIKRTLDKFLSDTDLREQLFEYRELFLSHIEKERPRKVKDNHNRERDAEIALFKKMNKNNVNDVLNELLQLYLRGFADRFNPLLSLLLYAGIRIINLPNILFRRNYYKGFFSRNIKIKGDIGGVRSVSSHSNVVYAPTFRSYYDFLFLSIAIRRLSLYVPRYFVSSAVIRSSFWAKLIRLAGGYIIDVYKFVNPGYREVIKSYLTTLVGHGVPVMFFPEIYVSKDGNIRNINREFITSIVESLVMNNEEIALIPIEISYYKKPCGLDVDENLEEISLKNDVLNNVAEIHFSKPILVSDFSSEDAIEELAEKLQSRWRSESFVFPHYIFCKILKDNNYTINMDDLKRVVKDHVKLNFRSVYKPTQIMKNGTSFIKKKGIGDITGARIYASQREEIDYYANLMY